MRYILIVLISVLLIACKNKGFEVELVTDDIFYVSKLDSVPNFLRDSVGDWVQPGAKGYGILAIIDNNLNSSFGIPIECEIVSFHANGIKCKVLKNAYPYGDLGCEKIGVSKGELWLEKEGNLFPSKEKAIAYLKKRNMLARDIFLRN